jgi:hypothetical protein
MMNCLLACGCEGFERANTCGFGNTAKGCDRCAYVWHQAAQQWVAAEIVMAPLRDFFRRERAVHSIVATYRGMSAAIVRTVEDMAVLGFYPTEGVAQDAIEHAHWTESEQRYAWGDR